MNLQNKLQPEKKGNEHEYHDDSQVEMGAYTNWYAEKRKADNRDKVHCLNAWCKVQVEESPFTIYHGPQVQRITSILGTKIALYATKFLKPYNVDVFH